MPETTTATPPANQGGEIDYEKLAAALAPRLATLVNKPEQQITQPVAQQASGDKPLTATELTKMLNERDQQNQSRQQLEAGKAKFTGEKMKDLPETYQHLLGNDPAKWASEEQDIRTRFKADFKLTGQTPPAVGGDASAGTAAAGAIDLSKMAAGDKLTLGLKQSHVGRGATVVLPATTTATAGAAK